MNWVWEVEHTFLIFSRRLTPRLTTFHLTMMPVNQHSIADFYDFGSNIINTWWLVVSFRFVSVIVFSHDLAFSTPRLGVF
jgi:hypothetical protein